MSSSLTRGRLAGETQAGAIARVVALSPERKAIIEALDRVVRHEPLYRVHQCVFGVLALESEPVDPRL